MQCSSVVSRFVTFSSACLLADFLLVVNLLRGDYGSAHLSNLCVCYAVMTTHVKYLHIGFQLNLWPIFNFKTHLWKL